MKENRLLAFSKLSFFAFILHICADLIESFNDEKIYQQIFFGILVFVPLIILSIMEFKTFRSGDRQECDNCPR